MGLCSSKSNKRCIHYTVIGGKIYDPQGVEINYDEMVRRNSSEPPSYS